MILLLLALATLVGTEERIDTASIQNTCTHQGFQIIRGIFGSEVYDLCVKRVNIDELPFASESAAILLDPDAAESSKSVKGVPLSNITLVHGYLLEQPGKGSFEGYIGDDHQLYGVLNIGNRTLHADPYGEENWPLKIGPFEYETDATGPGMPRGRRNRFFEQYEDPFNEQFTYLIEERARLPGVARARVCELLLLADKKFYENDANFSLDHAVKRMIHAVAQADIVFRNTDFNGDGVPDNIGFSVKYIIVLTSNETTTRVFGRLLEDKVVDGRQYLLRFSRVRRLSEVCLGVAFSGHAFHNKTLGLSFTALGGGVGGAAGGLCDRRAKGRSFNTLIIAHAMQDDERVPERVAALTLAHEMGHSFGAHHDDNFPNPECRGFIMDSKSTNMDSDRQYEFSTCSKQFIAATLSSMSYCLTEEDRPYCGNGIVESGEVCDCGIPSSCHRRDPCCTPRAGGAHTHAEGTLHLGGCEVAPKAQCHPSQGMCCTTECKYADLDASGIDCKTLDQECTCMQMTSSCRCALGGRCLTDSSCHAAECAILGLRECRCSKKGPGGTVTEARMCGICCLIEAEGNRQCVGAELAAKRLQGAGFIIPPDWPNSEYVGPNVTLRLCSGKVCRHVTMRAWPPNGPCVSRGVVGICSLSGDCKPRYLTPRTNTYPTVRDSDVKCVSGTDGFMCLPKHGIILSDNQLQSDISDSGRLAYSRRRDDYRRIASCRL